MASRQERGESLKQLFYPINRFLKVSTWRKVILKRRYSKLVIFLISTLKFIIDHNSNSTQFQRVILLCDRHWHITPREVNYSWARSNDNLRWLSASDGRANRQFEAWLIRIASVSNYLGLNSRRDLPGLIIREGRRLPTIESENLGRTSFR